jgi:hypothetical protein
MALTIRDNLYFCLANEQLVFLDLASDRYQAAPPACAQAFGRLAKTTHPSAEDLDALTPLLKRGFLVPSEHLHDTAPTSPRKAERSIFDRNRRSPSLWWVGEALAYQMSAMLQLRILPIAKLMHHLRAAKISAIERQHAPNPEHTGRLVAAFLATRQLISAHEKCLRDSIALTQFLLSHDITATLTLGVQMRPFAAHAWVEAHEMILNDTVDRVRPYTPIFRV